MPNYRKDEGPAYPPWTSLKSLKTLCCKSHLDVARCSATDSEGDRTRTNDWYGRMAQSPGAKDKGPQRSPTIQRQSRRRAGSRYASWKSPWHTKTHASQGRSSIPNRRRDVRLGQNAGRSIALGAPHMAEATIEAITTTVNNHRTMQRGPPPGRI